MPITSFEIWNDFKSRVNTDQNGWFRPETDFIRALNEASTSLFNELVGMAEKSEDIIDFLRPFLLTKNVTVTPGGSYGLASFPKEYARFSSARVLVHKDKCLPSKECGCDDISEEEQEKITEDYYNALVEYKVEKIHNQNWGSVLQHLTKGPKFPDKVKMTQYDKGFKVAPRIVSVIVLDYYKEPKPATFNYTITPGNPQTGSGDQLVYDPNSTPLEWPATAKNKLIDKLVDAYNLFTRDSQAVQIKNAQKPI